MFFAHVFNFSAYDFNISNKRSCVLNSKILIWYSNSCLQIIVFYVDSLFLDICFQSTGFIELHCDHISHISRKCNSTDETVHFFVPICPTFGHLLWPTFRRIGFWILRVRNFGKNVLVCQTDGNLRSIMSLTWYANYSGCRVSVVIK